MWRARTARTLSLSLLLALMFGIYLYHGSGYPSHHSYPFKEQHNLSTASSSIPSSSPTTATAFDPYSHLASEVSRAPWWHDSPSASFWQALNPADAPTIRVLVEPWTVVSLRSSGTRPNVVPFASWALFRPRVRAIIWFIKLVVLPIAGTTAILWVVLLYLLKDTELLDAQRNKSDAGEDEMRASDDDDDDTDRGENGDDDDQDDLNLSLSIGPKAHATDVELVITTGGYVVSAATDSSLSVWRPSSSSASASTKRATAGVGGRTTVRQFSASAITALDASSEWDLVVVGFASGDVALLHLATLRPYQSPSSATTSSSRVQYLKILPPYDIGNNEARVVSVHRDGSLYARSVTKGPVAVRDAAQTEGVAWTAVDAGDCIALCSSDQRMVVGRVVDERFEVLLGVQEEPGVFFRCAALSSLSFSRASVSTSVTRGSSAMAKTILAGTTKGTIVAWDVVSGEEVARIELNDGPVTRLTTVPSRRLAFSRGEEFPKLVDVVVASSSSMVTVLALGTSQTAKVNGQQQEGLAPPSPTHLRTPMRRLGSTSSGLSNGGSLSPDPTVAQTNGFEKHQRVGSHSSRRRSFTDQTSSNYSQDSHDDHDEAVGEDEVGEVPAEIGALVRLASAVNPRGGADIVGMQDGAAKLLGVCRRTDSLSNAYEDPSSARWEVWQMDLARPLLHQHQAGVVGPVVGGWAEQFTRRIPLDIEENLIGEPQRLSFTRIRASSVLCVENRPTPSSKRKSKLAFSFGNSVALLRVTAPLIAAIREEPSSAESLRRRKRRENGSVLASPSTPTRLSLPRR